MQIIRPSSSDPIAQPRPASQAGKISKIIGRLVAILAIAGIVLALGWLRSLWPA